MSALSVDWAPGIAPGARPFENPVESLELVGVQLASEQIDLGEQAARFYPSWMRTMYCLTLVALPDPQWAHSAALGMPAFTLDEFGVSHPVIVPAVAEIDCSEWETFDEQQPNWRRFPSVLARRRTVDAWGMHHLHALEPIRLWHCWPLDELDVPMVEEAVEDWLLEEWKPYLAWLDVRDEGRTVCDAYAECHGLDPESHRHEYDERGDLVVCREGEAWIEHYGENNILLDEDVGDPYPAPFAPIGGLHHLAEVWEHLLASSQANTMAALEAYPPWEHDLVARTERHYSPWLWSS